MIRWLEANGYNVSYASGIDTDRRGSAALKTHKVFLSVGHDEYWSGSNAPTWKPRLQPGFIWDFLVAMRSIGRRAGKTASPARALPIGRWSATRRPTRVPRLIHLPSGQAHGVIHASARPLTGPSWNALTGHFAIDAFRYDPILISSSEGKARFWRNTGIDTLADGQTAELPAGVLGLSGIGEGNGFRPPGLFRLSTTTLGVDSYLKDYGSVFGPGIGTHSLTLYRHSSGALVFGAGTIQWSWGLDATHDIAGLRPTRACGRLP